MSGRWGVIFLVLILEGVPLRAQRISIPQSQVRAMAEWEEVEYLLLTWTQFIPTLAEVVRHTQDECQILIVCEDSNLVKQDLRSLDVPLHNLLYLERPFNSIWMRDYGPMTVYDGVVGNRLLVDWVYNRPRPEDDALSKAIARTLGIPWYALDQAPFDLVHIGGNFITDGAGLGLSSDLVLKDNQSRRFTLYPKTEAAIDSLMRRSLGLDRFVKLTALPFDHIHHLDMHMQLLDEETLLVGEYPAGIADGPQIEENLQFLIQHVESTFGHPMRIIRVPMPSLNGLYPDTKRTPYLTHTNLVIVNRTILVPVYGGPTDSIAMQTLQEEFPGYRIVGIDCKSVIQAGGALHCITRTIGVEQPLRIVHRPIREEVPPYFPLEISAEIFHQESVARATIHYRYAGDSSFIPVPMIPFNAAGTQWSGYLPIDRDYGSVEYYIEAEAATGKVMTRPMSAPQGYWRFPIAEPTLLGLQDEF